LGTQYRTVIFYHSEEQYASAVQSKIALEQSGRFSKPIVTQILPATAFYPAEEYHQGYHKKNPKHYKADREKSGRDTFLKEHWSGNES
jgi:peptide-methionine (S)-S-oxide reductase